LLDLSLFFEDLLGVAATVQDTDDLDFSLPDTIEDDVVIYGEATPVTTQVGLTASAHKRKPRNLAEFVGDAFYNLRCKNEIACFSGQVEPYLVQVGFGRGSDTETHQFPLSLALPRCATSSARLPIVSSV